MAFEIPVLDLSCQAIKACIQYRVVIGLTGASPGVQPSTGTAITVRPVGVAQNAATTSQPSVSVRVYGVTKVEASSRAIAVGNYCRCTSGAASTATRLGGTVNNSTVATQNLIGIALTSAAAGTGRRYISMLVNHMGLAAT